ncbi:MAG TPA: hypothetical protein VH277_02715 [Gemmatimonadaceae bacterium]|nr:hypothetical protein [Gemmatimonadaceae bacterium]
MSVTAGVALSAFATGTLALGLASGLVPSSIFGPREIIVVAVRAFVGGAIAGGLFTWLVAGAERGHTLSTVSPRRIALWGGLATATLPLLVAAATPRAAVPIAVLAAATALYGIGGAGVSAGMLRLARRAPARAAE